MHEFANDRDDKRDGEPGVDGLVRATWELDVHERVQGEGRDKQERAEIEGAFGAEEANGLPEADGAHGVTDDAIEGLGRPSVIKGRDLEGTCQQQQNGDDAHHDVVRADDILRQLDPPFGFFHFYPSLLFRLSHLLFFFRRGLSVHHRVHIPTASVFVQYCEMAFSYLPDFLDFIAVVLRLFRRDGHFFFEFAGRDGLACSP